MNAPPKSRHAASTPQLIIVRGLPGSGKSTHARSLLERGDCDAHFETDAYFMVRGKYVFNRNDLTKHHQRCLHDVAAALQGGKRVVVSNTFSTWAEITPYVDLGYSYTIVEMSGTYQSIHNVPEHAIQRMRARWEKVDS